MYHPDESLTRYLLPWIQLGHQVLNSGVPRSVLLSAFVQIHPHTPLLDHPEIPELRCYAEFNSGNIHHRPVAVAQSMIHRHRHYDLNTHRRISSQTIQRKEIG